MRVVFFSLVSVDKGAQLALDAADMLPNVEFHFYGRVEPAFEREFTERVESLGNAAYHGVFDSVKGNVLAELNQYDLHLFPTMCPNEGVPGVIVETKLAAVPTVASARGYSAELIEDGVDGVLAHEDSAQELAGIVGSLADDPARVDSMKSAALESAERFYVDRYLNWIVSDMHEGAMMK